MLCEKPVAMDLAQAWSMVRACEAAGVVFGVNHHLPAHTTHAEIRRLVADGAVGRPMSVRVFFSFELAERLRGWRLTDADLGGPILDLMPHVASVVNKLVGLPLDASAMAVRQGMWAPGLEGDAEDRAMSVVRISGLEALHALAVTLAVKQAGVTGRTVPIDLEPPGWRPPN